MQLTILGSGTSLPTQTRNSPGYLLEADNKKILLDSGSGTLRQLARLKGSEFFREINYLFYTHLHQDHIADLAPLLWPYVFSPMRKDLHIFGPRGIKKYYQLLVTKLMPGIEKKMNRQVYIKELSKNKFKLGNLKIETYPLLPAVHAFSPHSVGYAFHYQNKKFVYTGDTNEKQRYLLPLCKNADLLLIDCSTPDQFKEDGHLSPKYVGQIATRARAKKVVLTHLYQQADKYDFKKATQKYFKGPVVVARDFMKIEI